MSTGSAPPGDGTPPGWYPDPTHRFELRWFNGSGWTGDVASAGQRYVDPIAGGPAPSSWSAASGAGRRNPLAVAALVLGILAVLVAWMPFLVVIGGICGVAAVATAIVGRRRARAGAPRAGMALTGLILGLVGLVLVVPGIAMTVLVYRLVNPAPHEVVVAQCSVADGLAVMRGELTNLDDSTQDFTLAISISRTDDGAAIEERLLQVDDVPGGGSREFVTSVSTTADAVSCEVLAVLGHLPVRLPD